MATFPTTLPAPQVSGYSVEVQESVTRTEMEVGPARQRRRTSDPPDYVSATWLLTDSQLFTLREWLKDPINGAASGASWFGINLVTGRSSGLVSHEARVMGKLKISPVDGFNYTVSLTLEVRGLT